MKPLENHRLSWAQRKALHERLVMRAAALRGEMDAMLHSAGPGTLGLPDHRQDTDDDPVADLQASLDVATVERDSTELQEIDAALPSRGTA